MSDPAIEAAQRAMNTMVAACGDPGAMGPVLNDLSRDAAREALKPVRAVLDKLADDTVPPCDFVKRVELFERAISDLSPVVYTSEELGR